MFQRSRLLVCLAILGHLAGCNRPTPSAPAASTASDGAAGYRIAVIPKGTTHEFWKSVHAGARRAAQEAGNVSIDWNGPQLEDDRAGQISIVQGFITARVDGIVLAPLDSQALVQYVEEAGEEKIPVVIFDSGLDGPANNYVTYVATDNYQGGAVAALRMGEVLGGKGDVILLRYNVGSESTEQREEAFLETLKKEFPEINILSSDQYCGTTPEKSLDKATQVLSQYKDEVDGIFAVCEPNAHGTLGALRELELAGKVKFVAFDPNAELIDGLAKRHVEGIVLQDPVKMGYEAVRALLAHLKGETVEPRIDTGVHVATPENMGTPEIAQLLKPEQVEE